MKEMQKYTKNLILQCKKLSIKEIALLLRALEKETEVTENKVIVLGYGELSLREIVKKLMKQEQNILFIAPPEMTEFKKNDFPLIEVKELLKNHDTLKRLKGDNSKFFKNKRQNYSKN